MMIMATFQKNSQLLLQLLSVITIVSAQNNNNNDVLFGGCSTSQYYSQLQGSSVAWTFDEVASLVTRTHRNELPLLGENLGDDDIYQAVIDLDRGQKNNTVRLIYRDIDMDALPYGNPLYWDIERLWPEARGTSRPSLAFTDVHHIKPADYSVKETRGDLNFGQCGTVQLIGYCTSPATLETPDDTATDGKIWLPPARYRGDVARALLYVDLRYRQRVGSLDRSLVLKDCGPFGDYGMGYLSQLLTWHSQDPPDSQERQRNDRACSRWQGNRNPFIDYPDLATQFHGQPDTLLEQSLIYQSCIDVPTPSPTATPNECSKIRPGDIPFLMLNSDEPQEVLFFPLADIPGGIQLFITDNAWDGQAFIETEGEVTMTVPDNGIPGGISFGYGPSANLNNMWSMSGNFNLHTNGDNLFLYCLDADDLPHFISAISYTGGGAGGITADSASTVDATGNVVAEGATENAQGEIAGTMEVSWWMPPGLTAADYGEHTTALPNDLEDSGALYLPIHYNNNMYAGERSGGIGLLRIEFVNANNWEGSNVARFEIITVEVPGGNGNNSAAASSSYFLSRVFFVLSSTIMTWLFFL